jgi:hypothetical protein
MDANLVLQAVSTVGFPIVVCGYVLVRLEKKMEELGQAITSLTVQLKEGK